jgi:aromatic ring-opening dioxygenase LigB subunit
VFAAIAPHGGIAIAEACSPDERDVAIKTRAGMEELGRRFDAAKPDEVIVATPHNVHIANAMGVVVAGRVLEAMAGAGLPAVAVSFGSNDPALAVAPMDWGALIPLWFMGGRKEPPLPALIVTPARELSPSEHVTAGAAIAATAATSDRRIALIASADHGHAHVKDGPFGYHPAAAEFDALVTDIVGSNQLERLVGIPRELVDNAKADSWWQMLMLHGATQGWRGEMISYEAPTYFGMLTAAYEPR